MIFFTCLSASSAELKLNVDGSAVNPAAFQQHIRRDSQLITQLLQVELTWFTL